LGRSFPMTTRSWIRRLFDRTPRTLRTAPARRRPALEVLEERALFSVTPTSLALSVSNPTPVYGQTETLTAVVTTAHAAPTPTAGDGSVTFYNGATVLGSATLSAQGTATYTTGPLPPGALSLSATYSGNNNFQSSHFGIQTANPQLVVPVLALSQPQGVAVDGQGDVFIADT